MDHRLFLFLRQLRPHTTARHHLCRVQDHRLHLHPLGQRLAAQFIHFHQHLLMHPRQQRYRRSYPFQKRNQGWH